MMQQALQFLQDHNEVAFATSDGHLPKIRMFQIMKQEGTLLYFSTSAEKAVWKELMQNPNVEVLAYADQISAKVEYGILTITMPKTEPKQKVTKAIEVS